MPSFKIIGLPVLEKKIFKGFYHICAWRPSWSCDLDHLYKLLFPLPKEAPQKNLALTGQAVSEEKTFKIVNRRRQTTDAGPWVSYKLTYEPLAQVSSGELINIKLSLNETHHEKTCPQG